MADGKTDRTVGDIIGEFALIERLVSDTPTSPAIEVGPGDDAAVIGLSDGRVVACVDVLVEERIFAATGRMRSTLGVGSPPRACPTSMRWALRVRLCS